MGKGIKTYDNLSKLDLVEMLTEEFRIVKSEEEESHVKYNASTGTLHITDASKKNDESTEN